MRTYFLLGLIVIVTSIPSSIIVGGFNELTDPQSQDYIDVVNFVALQFPQLASWKVISVKKQIVNGANYVLSFIQSENSTQNAEVRVYSTTSGALTVQQYIVNSQPQPIPLPKRPANLITISSSSNNPSSNSTTNTSNITTLANKVSNVYMIYNANPDIILLGGYQIVALNDTSFQKAWDNAISNYPDLSSFNLLEVRRQVVAGTNYIFIAQTPSEDQLMVIKVFQSLNLTFTATVEQTNTAVGFSAQQILASQAKCIQFKPELEYYQLVFITNSAINPAGLKLIFVQDSLYVTAECTYQGQDIIVTFE